MFGFMSGLIEFAQKAASVRIPNRKCIVRVEIKEKRHYSPSLTFTLLLPGAKNFQARVRKPEILIAYSRQKLLSDIVGFL